MPGLPEENYGLHEHVGHRNRHSQAALRIGGEVRLDSPSVVITPDEFTTYLGYAKKGTANTSQPAFMITKITESGTEVHIKYAELGASDLIFDNYLTYDYTY